LELKTFSAVLRFTLQLEDQTAQFYRDASASDKCAQARQIFLELAESSRKRKQTLEKAARESVDHSLLEPISGLLEEDHAGTTAFSGTMSFVDALVAARQLEQRMQKFYSEAGEKIRFIPAVSRLYRRYAQDRAKALTLLQGVS